MQRSQNTRARQLIVSQIETQTPPESRSTIELKIIVDGPHTINKVGDSSILQSNQGGTTALQGIPGQNYEKPPGTDIRKINKTRNRAPGVRRTGRGRVILGKHLHGS